MAKETVIIFDGEDKFVNKSNKKYDAKKGIAQYVGGDGEVSTDTTTSMCMISAAVSAKLVIDPGYLVTPTALN